MPRRAADRGRSEQVFLWSYRGVIAVLGLFVFFASLFIWPDALVAHWYNWAEPRVAPVLVLGIAIWAFWRAGER
jgi:ABC-type nickel/cobalt efflux system permease component RcnA